jgi:hypothetical protein
MKTLAPAALAFAAALSVSAAAQPSPGASPAAPPVKHHPACFWRRMISGFGASDDNTLYVRVGVRDVYELKLFSNCFDLSWVHRVGLQSIGGFGSDICEGTNPGIDVVVRDIGIGRQRCPVTSVRKLTPPEIAALPKTARP